MIHAELWTIIKSDGARRSSLVVLGAALKGKSTKFAPGLGKEDIKNLSTHCLSKCGQGQDISLIGIIKVNLGTFLR